MEVLVVEGLDVEGLEELLPEAGRGVGEHVAEQGEGVEQGGISGGGRGPGEVG